MVGISKLYLGQVEPGDPLRYGRKSGKLPSHLLQFAADKKPVVVWNATSACNLRCRHCYASQGTDRPQLTTKEGLELIDQLAAFGVPVLLFSGGEPLLRRDIFELASYAVKKGLRTVFSTNGTLIDETAARQFAELGVSYVGISLDGIPETHDAFRGVPGAYTAALRGIRLCRDLGVKVGLRVTLTRANRQQLPAIFDLMVRERIPRICLYHLVSTGRGAALASDDLTPTERRETVEAIIDLTRRHESHRLEVLTVDNHCDGPLLYLRLLREGRSEQAEQVLRLLRMNGGNSSGLGIASIGWDGTVYPDQFWRNKPLGKVPGTPFGELWGNPPEGSLLRDLRNRREHLEGRCRRCRFLDICGGNFRARAEAATGNIWGEDPDCYLTDKEIGL